MAVAVATGTVHIFRRKGLPVHPQNPPDPRFPQRKHLHRLERLLVPGPPLFYLTMVVLPRRPVLDCEAAAAILVREWGRARERYGWAVGRYTVMPDHVHFFAAPVAEDAQTLSLFGGYWKRSTRLHLRRQVRPDFRWQEEFFDHLLRSHESYAQKWEYVRNNPVRQGLVARPEDWPYQGEMEELAW